MSSNSGGGSNQHTQKRRKKEEEGTDEEIEEEGVEGEDSTPYCFCQRPSFGEVRLIIIIPAITTDGTNTTDDWVRFSDVCDRMVSSLLRWAQEHTRRFLVLRSV